MGILSRIKEEAARSGSSREKFFFVKDGEKARVRFLQEIDDGLEVKFHDSFQENINVPCQSYFGQDCPYCGVKELRTRSLFCWSVYNYEADEVQILMYPVNQCSPLPQLVAAAEQYCTITDRDYVISCNGKGKNKTFSILPMDKLAFRISKAKAFSEEAVLKYIEAAYPMNLQSKRPGMAPVIHDEEDMQIPFNASNVPEDKTAEAKELYKECKSKGLHVEPRKSAEYYAKCLKDYAAQADAWGSDDLDNW